MSWNSPFCLIGKSQKSFGSSTINRKSTSRPSLPRGLMAAALLLVVASWLRPAADAQTSFGGGGAISISGANASGQSTLSVTGATGSVNTIQVSLNGVTSSGLPGSNSLFFTSFVLEPPGGTKFVLLGATGDSVDGDDGADTGSGLKNSTIIVKDGASTAPNGASWQPQGSTFTVEPSSTGCSPMRMAPHSLHCPRTSLVTSFRSLTEHHLMARTPATPLSTVHMPITRPTVHGRFTFSPTTPTTGPTLYPSPVGR